MSLYSKPWYQTLSKAFDISKKTDITSRDGLKSNASNISCVIASNWLIHESVERKPKWSGFNNFFIQKEVIYPIKDNIFKNFKKHR